MKKKLIIFLLALHLLLICMGTSIFDFSKVPVALQAPVAWYLSLVGGHPYSFFSPDIPTQTIVRCQIIYKSGETRTVAYENTNTTLALRTVYLFQFLDMNNDYETAARIAASDCINRSPSRIRMVKVSIGKYIVPSIADYKAGKPCTYSELYTQDFKP